MRTDTLTPAETERLIAILGRLGSDFDGERAAAGLLATRLLAAKRLTWADIIAPCLPPPEPQPGRDWFDDVTACLQAAGRLSDWERGFVSNLRGRRTISPRQRAVLADIVEQLARRCAA